MAPFWDVYVHNIVSGLYFQEEFVVTFSFFWFQKDPAISLNYSLKYTHICR